MTKTITTSEIAKHFPNQTKSDAAFIASVAALIETDTWTATKHWAISPDRNVFIAATFIASQFRTDGAYADDMPSYRPLGLLFRKELDNWTEQGGRTLTPSVPAVSCCGIIQPIGSECAYCGATV
jgi:hypothetical protein